MGRNQTWLARLDTLSPLTGDAVTLEPLAAEHVEELCQVGLDPALWEWTTSRVLTREDMGAYVDAALSERERGSAYPFTIRRRASGEVVGSTRFGNIDAHHRRLEIGWTWVAREHQRTAVNTEAKCLLLTAAFEELGCIRVELKTDALNARSRAAIARVGAQEEGVLRQHMVTADGRLRDTVYYSILDSEWPAVERLLRGKLEDNGAAAG